MSLETNREKKLYYTEPEGRGKGYTTFWKVKKWRALCMDSVTGTLRL